MSVRVPTVIRLFTAFLASLVAVVGLQVTVSAPAEAVGCTGKACDGQGPKGNGCFADQVNVASGGGNSTRLYYSRACNAFWAWSKNGALYWSSEVHLEMEEYVQKDNVTYVWVPRKRLTIKKGAVQSHPDPEWTNALGARTSSFRFRALWVDGPGEFSPVVTPWALGGRR